VALFDWCRIVADAVDEVGHALSPNRPSRGQRGVGSSTVQPTAWSKIWMGVLHSRVARQGAVLAVHFTCDVRLAWTHTRRAIGYFLFDAVGRPVLEFYHAKTRYDDFKAGLTGGARGSSSSKG